MSEPQHLFVAGLGRSGTTALTEVLASHPRIVLGMERYKRLWGRRIGELTADHFTRERMLDFSDDLTNVVPAVDPRWGVYYDAMAKKWDQAAFVGDKFTRVQMGRVWQNIPDARFLCIVRDIHEVATSWEKRATNEADRGWGSRDDARAAVEAWNTGNTRILRSSRRRPDQIRVLEYASFFGAADAAPLRAALDWLGLAWTAEIEGEFTEAHERYVTSIKHKQRVLPDDLKQFVDANADAASYAKVVAKAL